jgi:hypothetical protein
LFFACWLLTSMCWLSAMTLLDCRCRFLLTRILWFACVALQHLRLCTCQCTL